MNKNFAFAANYRDLIALAQQSGIPQKQAWEKLNGGSVLALTAQEFTGEEIVKYHPMGADFTMLDGKAAIVFPKEFKYADKVQRYFEAKIPGTVKKTDDKVIFIFPATVESVFSYSLLPDYESLEFCKANDINALFRLGTCPVSNGEQTAFALDRLFTDYPQIKNILPAGFIIAGNPNVKPIAEVLKKHGVSLSQTEFFKQVGASGAFTAAYPFLVPLHSLTADEVISKNISRNAIIERYVRAIHERSVRIILVRPFELLMGNKLDAFCEDLAKTADKLAMRGCKAVWPEPYRPWTRGRLAAFALALVFVSTVWFYGVRLVSSTDEIAQIKEIALLFALSLVYALCLLKISVLAKLTGGFCTGFVAAEAALCALDGKKKLLPALLIIFAGGLSAAAFYGTTKAALRLLPFSGVKLTLLLPPLLVLYHDLKVRIHDETAKELFARPALWGELALSAVVLAALLVMALRSDNVSDVPAFELAFRDFLERTLAVRPRTKEILIGYPALMLYFYVKQKDLFPHYREALRLAATLAFCSAMNTFCHFHTRLQLSVIRVLNGWWLGLVIGCIIVLILHFFIKIFCGSKKQAV
ncbi:MAG: DUF5693 family protein [Synergistaceae bacterium]|nr:DUF5693 family protein [Synergistaceae bacterium]